MPNKPKTYELKLTNPRLIEEKKKFLTRPVHQVELGEGLTIAGLVDQFKGASIQARNLGTCVSVLERLYADRDRPTVMLGLAGPLIAAGLRQVIRDMIVHKLVDVIVTTGAIAYQDYYQALGYQHFCGTPDVDDRILRDLLIDRIYDTYVDEEKFWLTDCGIGLFADGLERRAYSSREFIWHLAGTLKDERSILGTARRLGVPIFIPAINDSSIGIGLTEHYHRARLDGETPITISSIRDNYELTQIVHKSKATAAIYIAGGVPKNYINDSVVMAYIFGRDTGGHRYAIQLTTDVPHWGGLSGSTLSEATSWGKVNKEANHCMAFVEPSVSLPLVAGAIIEKKVTRDRQRLELEWEGDILKRLAVQGEKVKTQKEKVEAVS